MVFFNVNIGAKEEKKLELEDSDIASQSSVTKPEASEVSLSDNGPWQTSRRGMMYAFRFGVQ